VSGLAISPDSKLLATASGDRAIRLWSVQAALALGKASVLTLRGPAGGANCVAYHPGGRQVAGGFGPAVQLWEVGPGRREVTHLFTGHGGLNLAVAFSPDERSIMAQAGSDAIGTWNINDGRAQPVCRAQLVLVNGLAASPDGKFLAAASLLGHRVWEVGPRRLAWSSGVRGAIRSVFSPDGRLLASAGSDEPLTFRWAATGQVAFTLGGKVNAARDLGFGARGERVVIAADREGVILWDVRSRRKLASPPVGGVALSAALSPDGRYLATSADRVVKLWDGQTGAALHTLQEVDRLAVTGLSFSPDGRRLAGGTGEGEVRLWDTATGTVVLTLKGFGMGGSLAWGPRGGRIAAGTLGVGELLVWDAPGFRASQEEAGRPGPQ
jgi:WD40 repeat protein